MKDIQFPKTPFPLEPSLVLLGRRGSEAHGTYIPSTDPNGIDDRDLMGICIPPPTYILGLLEWQGAEEINGVWDVVLYDFRKFVRLLCKQNPNVLGMLWLEQEDYLHIGPVGQMLIDNRDLFRVRGPAQDSFIGYAISQLKKMTSGVFNGYMGAKRKALVEKFGYDTKNAAHLVRLLHMGHEYLETGRLQVRRGIFDREMLMSIKRGEWSLTLVQAYAQRRLELLQQMKTSVLPETIDEEAINDLVVRCMWKELQ